jgi:hypothetical protein
MAEMTPIESPTVRQHKRQFFWQILLPMLLVVIAALAIGGLVIAATFTGRGETRLWADVSIIWLLAPMLLLAFGLVAILFAVVYGMGKLLQVTPRYTGKAQGIFVLIAAWARKVADGATQPFVWFQQAGAAIKSIFKR